VETTDGEAAGTTTTSCAAAAAGQPQVEDEEERAWRAALARTFRRVDALASLACACGRIARPPCRCPLSGNSGIVGSTAVVAVLVRGRVVVANCGDSRAVLCRGPAGAPPVPLSRDHKVRTPPVLLRATRTTHPSGPAGQSLVDPCRGFARISGHACSGIPVDSSQLSGHPSRQPAVVAVAGSTRSGGDSRRGGQVSVSAGARGGRPTAVRRVPPAVRPWSTEAPPAGELLVSFSFSRPCLWYVMSEGWVGGQQKLAIRPAAFQWRGKRLTFVLMTTTPCSN
jgi:hypothetical protein